MKELIYSLIFLGSLILLPVVAIGGRLYYGEFTWSMIIVMGICSINLFIISAIGDN